MIERIFKLCENFLQRPLSNRDFDLIENWQHRLQYPEEFIETCLEMAKSYASYPSLNYVDRLLYNYYGFYKQLLKIRSQDKAEEKQKTEEHKDITDGLPDFEKKEKENDADVQELLDLLKDM